MSSLRYLLIVLVCAFLASCAAQKERKAYEKVLTSTYAWQYNAFLQKYPNSQYAQIVKDSAYQVEARASWKYAQGKNTVNDYEYVIKHYPGTKYVPLAQQKIVDLKSEQDFKDFAIKYDSVSLKTFLEHYPTSARYAAVDSMLTEERMWATAAPTDAMSAYENYLVKYPKGKYAAAAKTRITEIQTILPEWEKTRKINTEKEYKAFLQRFPNCSYTAKARTELEKFEEIEWNKCVAKNTLKAYKDFLARFPDGKHHEEADKRIIDIEVNDILAGTYNPLSPAAPGAQGNYKLDEVTMNIKNDTDYPLIVWLSGSKMSKKAVLLPNDSTSIEMVPGTYKIAAQIKKANVSNYVGSETLVGGNYYDYRFFIRREWSFGH